MLTGTSKKRVGVVDIESKEETLSKGKGKGEEGGRDEN
jgi:hypothetical protein